MLETRVREIETSATLRAQEKFEQRWAPKSIRHFNRVPVNGLVKALQSGKHAMLLYCAIASVSAMQRGLKGEYVALPQSLKREMGLSRQAEYAAVRRLKEAGLIETRQSGRKARQYRLTSTASAT